MPLPNNRLSQIPFPSDFREPRNTPRTNLQCRERGGTALNDPNDGIDVQNWTASCDGTEVVLTPEVGPQTVIYTGTNITEIDLAFDLTMAWNLALVEDTQSKFVYFSSVLGDYDTLDLGPATTPRCTYDDHRQRNSLTSSVGLYYVLNNTLKYRDQRDRYEVEYELATNVTRLVQVGMGVNRRMQFEFEGTEPINPFASDPARLADDGLHIPSYSLSPDF
jgi:hypothetical protein